MRFMCFDFPSVLNVTSVSFCRNVSCHSPPSLQGRLVAYLSEEEVLNSCNYWLCDLALYSQISLFIFIVVQAILLAAVVYFLRRFSQLSCDAQRAAAESFNNWGQQQRLANEQKFLRCDAEEPPFTAHQLRFTADSTCPFWRLVTFSLRKVPGAVLRNVRRLLLMAVWAIKGRD